EFIWEAGHRAADADAANVRAATDAGHPATFRDVAVDDWTPAAQLHDALGGAVVLGKVALLVVAGAIATLVNGLSEEPRWAQLVIERDHWCAAGNLIQQVKQGLHKVVRLHWAAGHVHDRKASFGSPSPTEVIS